MKKKIGVGLILSYLFSILLHSSVPISYAAVVENDESLLMEEIESVTNESNLKIIESPKSSNVEKKANNLENGEFSTESDLVNSLPKKSENIENEKSLQIFVLSAGVLGSTDLSASLDSPRKLSLNYSGSSVVKIELLSEVHITFILPEEVDVSQLSIDNISAYYDLRLLSNKMNEVDKTNININEGLNSIEVKIPKILFVDLLGLVNQKYKLTIQFDTPLTSVNGQLKFKSVGSEKALANLDILNWSGYEVTTINVPVTPLPPNLLRIYDNTIVIKGILPEDFQSSSTVHVHLPDGTRHPAEVSDGEFKLKLDSPLSEGEKVKAVITTETGLESSADTVTVQPAPPPLIIPKNLNFGTVTIGSDVPYKFLEEPLEIIVQDTSGTNESWQLQASIDQPLTTKSGHILPNALGFYEGEEFKPFTTNELGIGDAITIKTGTTENDEPVTFDWDPKQREGPVIKIDHSAVYAEPYSTEVTWTLVDAPK